MKDKKCKVIKRYLTGFHIANFEIPVLTLVSTGYYTCNPKSVLGFFYDGKPIIISSLKGIDDPQKWVLDQTAWFINFIEGWDHVQEENPPLTYEHILEPFRSFQKAGNIISGKCIEINPYKKRYKRFLENTRNLEDEIPF